jgi:hypothetical protein
MMPEKNQSDEKPDEVLEALTRFEQETEARARTETVEPFTSILGLPPVIAPAEVYVWYYINPADPDDYSLTTYWSGGPFEDLRDRHRTIVLQVPVNGYQAIAPARVRFTISYSHYRGAFINSVLREMRFLHWDIAGREQPARYLTPMTTTDMIEIPAASLDFSVKGFYFTRFYTAARRDTDSGSLQFDFDPLVIIVPKKPT